jgi:predicted MFS family arabinose efflux permease
LVPFRLRSHDSAWRRSAPLAVPLDQRASSRPSESLYVTAAGVDYPQPVAGHESQVIAQAGFYSLFFFVTLYMQNVLGLSPIEAGVAYIPVTIGVGISSGISTQLLPRIGSRPLIVAGTLTGAVGVFWLSRITAHGGYLADVLPGLGVMALGLGAVFVGVQTPPTRGCHARKPDSRPHSSPRPPRSAEH